MGTSYRYSPWSSRRFARTAPQSKPSVVRYGGMGRPWIGRAALLRIGNDPHGETGSSRIKILTLGLWSVVSCGSYYACGDAKQWYLVVFQSAFGQTCTQKRKEDLPCAGCNSSKHKCDQVVVVYH